MQSIKYIDEGRAFDWGKTSEDYAKYRDIYPPEFFQKLPAAGLCIEGQQVLDLGTGTGVLPRSLFSYGASFIGTDISENQIMQARRLSEEASLPIEYRVCPAEELDFSENQFDCVTACQCFFYFDHAVLFPKLYHILKPGGKLAILYMAWLPKEDAIAGASEDLVLRYNQAWSGRGETRHPLPVSKSADGLFTPESSEVFDLMVPFTRERWHGRIKSCRGIGASLSETEIAAFEQEHLALLNHIAPAQFEVLHYAAISILGVNK